MRTSTRVKVVGGALLLGALAGCGGGGGSDAGANSSTQGQRIVTGVNRELTPVDLAARMVSEAVYPQSRSTVCPAVSAAGSSVTLDYGSGCVSPNTGGHTVAGQASIALLSDSNSGTLTFHNLTVDSLQLEGSVTFQVQPGAATGDTTVTLAFSNLTLAGTGAVDGALTVRYTGSTADASVVTLNTSGAGLTLTPAAPLYTPCSPAAAAPYIVNLTGLTIDASSSKNLVAEAGSASVAYSEENASRCQSHLYKLAFSSSSPSSRTVQATFDNLPPVTIALPTQ